MTVTDLKSLSKQTPLIMVTQTSRSKRITLTTKTTKANNLKDMFKIRVILTRIPIPRTTQNKRVIERILIIPSTTLTAIRVQAMEVILTSISLPRTTTSLTIIRKRATTEVIRMFGIIQMQTRCLRKTKITLEEYDRLL